MPPLCSCLGSESAYFAYRRRHRPTPRPLAFNLLTLQCLITITVTIADYMFVYVLQKILSLLGLLGQNIMMLCHYAEKKRIMDNHIRHIVLDPPGRATRRATRRRFWVSYSAQALCTCSVSSSQFLVNFKRTDRS